MISNSNTDKSNYDIKVSAYCTSFNHERYIRQTLEGFINQVTNFRYEVIVHDDASTDRSAEIIKEYANRYPDIIKPVFQSENQYSKGVNIITKYIMPKLRGKYICCCEGDDYWNDPYKIQKQYDALEKNPECSLCTHIVQCCNEDGSHNERKIPEPKFYLNTTRVIGRSELAERYWDQGGYLFHTSSYFFKAEVLEVDFEWTRDIHLLRICLIKGACYFISKPMSVRRLWSVGNWNSILVEQGAAGRARLICSDIEFDEEFNRYTGFTWNDLIQRRIFENLVYFGGFYPVEAKKKINESNLKPWRLRKKPSFKKYTELLIKYLLLEILPNKYLYFKKFYLKIKGAVSQRP